MEVARPAKAVQIFCRKCYLELSEVRITVQDVCKSAASGFVSFEECNVVMRLAAVEKKFGHKSEK